METEDADRPVARTEDVQLPVTAGEIKFFACGGCLQGIGIYSGS